MCLSVAVRGFAVVHRFRYGRMTDRNNPEDDRQGRMGRSGGLWPRRAKRSVKPSAQPTMVRIHHLPPPAKTARELGYSRLRVPSCVVSSCVIVGQETSLRGDSCGHIDDMEGYQKLSSASLCGPPSNCY